MSKSTCLTKTDHPPPRPTSLPNRDPRGPLAPRKQTPFWEKYLNSASAVSTAAATNNPPTREVNTSTRVGEQQTERGEDEMPRDNLVQAITAILGDVGSATPYTQETHLESLQKLVEAFNDSMESADHGRPFNLVDRPLTPEAAGQGP